MINISPNYLISADYLFKIVFSILSLFWVLSYLSSTFTFLINISYLISFLMMISLFLVSKVHSSYLGRFLIFFSLFVLVTFTLSRFYYQTTSLAALTLVLNLWIGLGLYIYGTYFSFLKLLHIVFCLYVLISIVIFDISPSSVMLQSYNHISIVAIGLLAVSNFDYDAKKKNLFLFQAYITFVVCLFSIGRAGILSSAILVILTTYFFIKDSKLTSFKKSIIFISFIGLLIAAILIFINSDLAIRFISSSFNLSGREEIFSKYFEYMTLEGLLLGHDVNFSRVFLDPKLSIHNSFLGMHQAAGIFGIFLIVMILIVLPIIYKHDSIHFLIYSTILIRSFTDNVLFTSGFIYGAVITAYVFYAFNNIKKYNI